MREITSTRLILLVALFLIAFANVAFFTNVLDSYPFTLKNLGFLISLAWVFAGFIVLLLSLACYRYTIKPVVITLLLVSSVAAYFMDSYNTILDDSMIRNIVNTDVDESLDLLSARLIAYFFFLGILPSVFVYRAKIIFRPMWQEFRARLKLLVLTLTSILVVMFAFSNFYTSFIREHKELRLYNNPTYYVYSTGYYLNSLLKASTFELRPVGLDARKVAPGGRRKLVIFIVGEAVRADRFSLNGYTRETNPLLKKENIVSFTNFWSCGTSTAVSVPCMFSVYDSSSFDLEKAQSTENVLDVLQHAGVNLLWLDNNSNSKGVAERIPYQNYKRADLNPLCDTECRDEGMLLNLQAYIDEHRQGDIFIVLHQMGNHGPAYYKRYLPEFERFTPVCQTNQLEDCTREEISNAYDNAILYTDYFLSRVIEFLGKHDEDFATAMFYASDHGESLGENGLYLHGLPNFVAPDTQRLVSTVIWLGDNFDRADIETLAKKRDKEYSHDNIFHTVLGLMGIETSVYDRELDILQN